MKTPLSTMLLSSMDGFIAIIWLDSNDFLKTDTSCLISAELAKNILLIHFQ